MTAALWLLPPVIDQSIQRVPLDPWSAAGFAAIAISTAYLGFRRSPWIAALLAFSVPFAGYRDIAHTTLTVEKSVAAVVLFWIAVTFVERIPRSPAYFAGGVAAAATIVSTLAVAQGLVGGAPSGIWVNGRPLPRVASTLEGSNQLAGFLEAVLPVAWVWPMLASGWLGWLLLGAGTATQPLARQERSANGKLRMALAAPDQVRADNPSAVQR